MADFAKAIEYVLKNEGGYVDDPNDNGGATNLGITQGTLSLWRKKEVTKDDVLHLTEEEAKNIYKSFYWDKLHCGELISQELATVLFDAGVNFGVASAAKKLQRVLKVKDDGIIGPVTLGKINSSNPKELIKGFIKEAQNGYVGIVLNKPSQLAFLHGWISRTHRYFDFL